MRAQIGFWIFLLIAFLIAIAVEIRMQRKLADSPKHTLPAKPVDGSSAAHEELGP